MPSKPSYISKDYHLELMSLFEFANSCIINGTMSKDAGKQLYEIFKNVIIRAEIQPFLWKHKKNVTQSDYDKYYRLAHETNEPMLSDLFEKDGDLYDLMSILNISKYNLEFHDFAMLFLLKISEIESNNSLLLEEFLDFQLFDNFLGDPERLDSFCHYLTENDGFCQLSSYSIQTISNWYDNYNKNTDKNPEEDEETIEENTIIDEQDIVETNDNATNKSSIEITATNDNENNASIDNNDVTKSFVLTEPFAIKGRFTIEQIQHYFSFLYKERSCNKQPFLKEAEVELMFKNGLVIPVEPLNVKFKLNVDVRFPRRIIDFAIHNFYVHNNIPKCYKKADYFRFFGSYIEDYQKALGTTSERENFLSNISGESTRKMTFKIEKYLPK